MSVLIDSDIVIEILRSRDPVILALWNTLSNSGEDILFSPITAAEVWAGARPGEHQAISNFFPMFTCAASEYETGRLAGEFLRQFFKSHNLKIGDALIAATAVLRQSALWTRNRIHYPMPGLTFFS
ncbi:MAG: type II toxin-antitoxin system VapC family toxin [Terracidiphilus sp.]